jgi:hypothetical protein
VHQILELRHEARIGGGIVIRAHQRIEGRLSFESFRDSSDGIGVQRDIGVNE